MKIWGKTDIGKARRTNQDDFFCEVILDEVVIFCVCDGMGGTNGGHIASKYAAREFIHEIKKQIRIDISDDDAKKILAGAVWSANNFVFDMASCDASLRDMGTTLVGGFLISNKAYLANVGDSRCYHVDQNNITQVTKDHSLVQQLLDNGQISINEKKSHPKKNYITRAVGVSREITSDIFKVKFDKNEFLLLCSDGLYNLVDNELMKEIILMDINIDKKCDKLIEIANENGGSDNITAVILEF
ncbi:MAG: Stp1/IreP family PP2C-type Ser/Thr phosphatase [Clostridia bacterium]